MRKAHSWILEHKFYLPEVQDLKGPPIWICLGPTTGIHYAQKEESLQGVGHRQEARESFMKLQLLTHRSKMVWLKGKNKALKEMVSSMLSYSSLSDGFWETPRFNGILFIEYDYAIIANALSGKKHTNDEIGLIMGKKYMGFIRIPPGSNLRMKTSLGCPIDLQKKSEKVDGKKIDKIQSRICCWIKPMTKISSSTKVGDGVVLALGEAVPLEGLHIDDKLQFVEEPVEIMEREIKRLKRSRIPLVKVRWNSRRGPEFTWEREDSFKKKYPHLFTNRASSSTATS
ncbi:hypothetical protein Tco_0919356 [Tanacetum coccineum]